jgi:hypothetical protein
MPTVDRFRVDKADAFENSKRERETLEEVVKRILMSKWKGICSEKSCFCI